MTTPTLTVWPRLLRWIGASTISPDEIEDDWQEWARLNRESMGIDCLQACVDVAATDDDPKFREATRECIEAITRLLARERD